MPMSHLEIQQDRAITFSDDTGEASAPRRNDLYVNANADSSDGVRFRRVHSSFLPMFATQKWQKLYAQALLETDTDNLSLLIVLAEEAVLDRYIELVADVSEPDEVVDLRNAAQVLSELREVNSIGYVDPEFLA
jgi:hypothetical protein